MTTPLFVSADWLQEHYNDETLQVLDARMLPPGMDAVRNIQAEYLAGHLPQAPFFNIEALSDHTSPYPHMLPRAESFAVAMRELGVNSDKHLIVYDEGNLFSAPRAWWMLRAFGVAQVSILAGGLQGWKAAGFALAEGEVSLPEGEFEAEFDDGLVKRLTDVLLISHEGGAQIVDARAANRFNAEVDEPRPGLHRGHIPNSLNLPWNLLVEQGQLKPESELRALFAQAGVDLTQPVVATCGSGVTAVVLILALTSLGVREATLYDGSWGEWGSRDDLPIAK
ncbi:thiosulfate/3-mercaptopyruvate sulfurtransferase [Pantoea sp. PA1]|jgi:thiosulfate/3-mercaptopyruvate sulfurtransferase|uniref:3-mercaptopyruvate sulfurtransferase n=1 Tax=Pantoea TaxID=53335 RepID=UPI000347448E|nr:MULTISPECIES: 3-mercaptopyruvate sulfurtransferase [Pantoea]AMB76746.1 3-mercaptopyruvate sulfurtransferase [Pantoea ananatis]ASN14253.1 3-mercaptopyruvate sulfurtransferase [Pantoea ananatis]MCH9270915.1 3-mercaptopyruvate sulfurtransferase [Pantoea ananatis]MDC7868735.1 3-mercaptopyruvate sulfurtransferase [Pantoea ananatis]MDH0052993.1 3-mercaptopyruvate sulfurtransferase [Pantoea ananatis]